MTTPKPPITPKRGTIPTPKEVIDAAPAYDPDAKDRDDPKDDRSPRDDADSKI